jgi:serine/threonine protein kinase
VDRAGIQPALDYREAELGPALVFEYDPNAVRLDRYLGQKLAGIALGRRLALIRQLGEAMAYAHGKRLYHRGLAPQSILVRDPDGDAPRLQITNWQVASRSEGTSVGAAMTAGTLHVEDHLADPAKVYLAPDAVPDGDEGAARADVFSRGAIAYHILMARPPVPNPFDLPSRLREGNGLVALRYNEWCRPPARRAGARVRGSVNRPSGGARSLQLAVSTVVVCFRYRLRPD